MKQFAEWFTSSKRENKQLLMESSSFANAPAGVTVFKQKDGNYRWLAVSSNAFMDGDKEIVSTKALEDDVARDGDRGPLRWWHEPQLDLGKADFSAMHGKMLIESGTFKSREIARAIALKAKNLSMSVGFVHPRSEPDSDGVFHNIRIFERSLLPQERAANKFTKFEVVEENSMNETKYKALKDLVGDALVAKILGSAEISEKEAMADGIRFKQKAVAADEILDEELGDEVTEKAKSRKPSPVDEDDFSDLSAEEIMKMVDELISEKEAQDELDLEEQISEETTMKAKSAPAVEEEEIDEVEGDDEEAEAPVMASKKNELKDKMMASKKNALKDKMMASKKAKPAAVDPEDEEEVEAADELEDEEEEDAMASKKNELKDKMMASKKMHDKKDKMMASKKAAAAPDDEEEDEEEDDDEEAMKELSDGEIAYMTPSELADLLTSTISEVVSELGVTESLDVVTKELKAYKRIVRELQAEVAAGLQAVTTKEKNTKTLMGQIEKLDTRLKELEGDAPKASKKGYRASQDGDTEIDDNHRLKGVEPEADPLDHFRMFLNGHKQ